jgi:hypothetical protein
MKVDDDNTEEADDRKANGSIDLDTKEDDVVS